ncbi:MAG: ATP-binding cassette domain-containing protein [Candidatus Geothermincolia bacterium]
MANESAAIKARQLHKTYKGGVKALDGIGLTVAEGGCFGLLGPNGAGKSTTVKILTTLTLPDSGTAEVAGIDVLRHPEQVRRSIGVVGQKSAVDQTATGRENLMLQGRVHGLGGATLKRRVSELLEEFGLSQDADRIVRGYSGGMQRRLDVALGLVQRPRILFLDEPTVGLDPEVRVSLWSEITRLVNDEGMTILFTTHYLEEADQHADEMAIIDKGRVVVCGTPERLKSEMRGDGLHLELARTEDEARICDTICALPGISEVNLAGNDLRARAEKGSSAVPVVLSALEAAGIPVWTVTVSRPSLDDVYLRYAGREFAEADQEAAPEARKRGRREGEA